MLPLIVTVCLSRGARAMASGKAIVRRLDAIETLGGMDVLCVDKTGTLTSGVIKLSCARCLAQMWSARRRARSQCVDCMVSPSRDMSR